MNRRLDYQSAAPKAIRSLFEAGRALADSGVGAKLLVLTQIRASQINGCAFCLALHTKEALALGEPVERITGLDAWRETPWYTERERMALEWTEALVTISRAHPEEDLFKRARTLFSERELVLLTVAVNTITSWNQLNVAFATNPELAEEVFHNLYPNGVPA